MLKQIQYRPMSVADQIIILLTVTNGLFDELEIRKTSEIETTIRVIVRKELQRLFDLLNQGEILSDEDLELLLDKIKNTIKSFEIGA